MSKVLLFSTLTCSWCRRAKRYFKDRGVPFKEINIEFSSYYSGFAPQGGLGRRAVGAAH
jgi:glutaredoxin